MELDIVFVFVFVCVNSLQLQNKKTLEHIQQNYMNIFSRKLLLFSVITIFAIISIKIGEHELSIFCFVNKCTFINLSQILCVIEQ